MDHLKVEEVQASKRHHPVGTGGFGCTGNAFGYSTLNNRKNCDADAHNPNLYMSIDDLKDNRKLENMYEEIQKKAAAAISTSSLSRRTRASLRPEMEASEYVGPASASYDQLEFARPMNELMPNYHSTSTLKSIKSSTSIPKVLQCNSDPENDTSMGSRQRHSTGRLSQGHIHQVGDFSKEVLRSIGVLNSSSSSQDSNGTSDKLFRTPVLDGSGQKPQQLSPPLAREPDSGISSARSTGTTPWSQNEAVLPALQHHGGEIEGLQEEHQL
eukprot:maker-scaffold69_size418775-snap-gene-0.17 protein:Tk03246 transcript:maker-scaffold69_size418775-snap-gene-0.17-mRNA-1 annotation:"dienelactone hydrolase"